MRIMPYKFGSKSAKALSQALGIKRVRHDGTFKNNYVHPILNWGSSVTPNFPVHRWINNPSAVNVASNKLSSFRKLSNAGLPVPWFTTDDQEAIQKMEDGTTIVSRTILRGHSGNGIYLCNPSEEYMQVSGRSSTLVSAPLYVEYIKKQEEYRYHVFNGEVIDIQMKRKRREVENEAVNYQVRNAQNGWVYCRDDISPSSSLSTLAVDSVRALGLDFGAVDIIWNESREQGYVLEVNTACGLEGTTVDKYVEAIGRVI